MYNNVKLNQLFILNITVCSHDGHTRWLDDSSEC